jgi:indole-3-glycerol phosphate synthase
VPPTLEQIVVAHRARAAADTRDPAALERRAMGMPATRGFRARLAASDGLAVVAEIKRRSPSRGDLAPDLDPGLTAARYAQGGAACLSVLTDRDYFGGSPEDLEQARGAGVPVLRKDFTVCPNDVCDARLMGADAVLLIVAALGPDELGSLFELAGGLGLDALVEVHDERELDLALAVDPALVGVNQRNLKTFDVDRGRAAAMAGSVPRGVVAVAESGVHGPEDAARAAAAGYDAVLVGEWLVTSEDPAAAVASLCGHPVGERAGAVR